MDENQKLVNMVVQNLIKIGLGVDAVGGVSLLTHRHIHLSFSYCCCRSLTFHPDNHRLLQTDVYNRSFKRKDLPQNAALRKEELMLVPSR